jgi:hypothetical protein
MQHMQTGTIFVGKFNRRPRSGNRPPRCEWPDGTNWNIFSNFFLKLSILSRIISSFSQCVAISVSTSANIRCSVLWLSTNMFRRAP